MTDNPNLVSTEWLSNNLDNPDVSIVDGSWYLPAMFDAEGSPRNGHAEYLARHIPGAVFFNIDGITEPGSNLPHTIAPPDIFSQKTGELGVSDQDTIVVYDGMGLFSAPRVWWNFKVMGAKNVRILDGGLPAWEKDGYPVESGEVVNPSKLFDARFDNSAIISFNDMQEIVANGQKQIADARPAGRFTGEQPEPRKGMRSGHMPGAKSVPFSNLAANGKLLPADELKNAFNDAGIDLTKPIATSCGSGVTAAALILALQTIGHTDNVLYDGSWAEWGGRPDTDIITGG